MMFRCEWCGAEFEEPEFITRRENLDGENGWWTHTDAVCPWCGDDSISEVEDAGEEDDT